MYEVGDILFFYKDCDHHYDYKPYWRLGLLVDIDRSDPAWDFYSFLILGDAYNKHNWVGKIIEWYEPIGHGWNMVKRIN